LFSFRTKTSDRRNVFLALSAQIEQQLREAYHRKFQAKQATQSSLAKKLGVDRSAIHRRLTGRTNMTIETVADMVWGLDQHIDVCIYDRADCMTHDATMAPMPGTSGDEITKNTIERAMEGMPRGNDCIHNQPTLIAA